MSRPFALPLFLLLLGSSLWSCSNAKQTPAETPSVSSPAPASAEATSNATPAPAATSSTAQLPDTEWYAQLVASPDRSDADRALDSGRKPQELLSFFGIKPGMQIAELVAGGGYTAELLTRAVGTDGKVYGQNTPFILQRFAEGPWTERLKKPLMQAVVRIDSEMDDPLPGQLATFDAIFFVLFYHDTVWMKTDRARMNRALFAALKPGGFLALVDHSARAGDGIKVAESLHRIEESTVVSEVTAAGFVLEKSGDFLRNPADRRDWSASPRTAGELRGTSDRFVLLFRKSLVTADAQHDQKEEVVTCTSPRPKACTKEYLPVCATVDTGIRCITTPCDSSTTKTYASKCTACADNKVMSFVPNACPQP